MENNNENLHQFDKNKIQTNNNAQSKTKIYQDIEFSTQINFDSKLDDYQYHSVEQNQLINNSSTSTANLTNSSSSPSNNHKNQGFNHRNKSQRRHFGNNCVCFFKNGEPLITIGPHWPMFVCVQICFLVAGISIAQFLALNISTTYYILTLLMTFIQVGSYSLVALVNPGICSTSNQLPDEEFLPSNYCKPCRVVQNKEMYHCLDCDICVRGYDHHCPWVGKCVAEGNLVYFYLFLCSTFSFLMYCIFIALKGV